MLIKVTKLNSCIDILPKCVSVNFSGNFEIIGIQTSCGLLKVYHITKPHSSVVCNDVLWNRIQEEKYFNAGHTFLVGSLCGTWSLYSVIVADDTLKSVLTHTWNFENVLALREAWITSLDISDISETDVNILAFRRNRVYVCLQRQLLCSVDAYSDRLLDTRSIFRIAEEDRPARWVHLADKCLCTLEYEGLSISLYDIEKGIKMADIRLDTYNISEACEVYISFSTTRLLILDCKRNAFTIKVLKPEVNASKNRKAMLVTAFTKQLSSTPRRPQLVEQKICENVDLLGDPFQVAVEDTCAFMCLKKPDGKYLLQVVNFDTGLQLHEELPDDNPFLVKPTGHICPPILLSGSNLYVPALGLSATEFVNKLMLYSSGTMVEYLASMNNWEDLSVNLDVLAIGLKNRQLDTIAFFLGAKFQEDKGQNLSEWMSILRLLQKTIMENASDNSSRQFSEQLLQMSLKTLVELLAVACSQDGSGSQESKETYTRFLIAFRGSLKESRSSSTVQGEVLDAPFNSDHCLQWEHMTRESIMDDAMKKGCVPLAQWFLLSRASESDRASLNEIQERAPPLANLSLCNGDLQGAISIIANAGLSVERELSDLFELTTVSSVRCLLSSYLSSKGRLSPVDSRDLVYLSLFESLYPSPFFMAAKPQSPDDARNQPHEGPPLPPMNLLWVGDSRSVLSDQDIWSAFDYSQLSLVWIRDWDLRTRQVALVPALLKGKVIPLEHLPTKEVLWESLLQRGEGERLLQWITCFVGSNLKESRADTFPFGWPIDAAMVNKVNEVDSPPHVREYILNALARQGIFCHEEHEDIQRLLCRLGSCGVLLKGPHLPVQKKSHGSTSSLPPSDYNHRLVHFCLKNNLYNLLFYFLRNDGRILPFSDCPWCRVPIVAAVQAFKLWENKPEDSSACYQAVLSSAQLIYKLPDASIQALCQEKSVPDFLVAAALLYSPQPIREVLMSSQNKETLEGAIDSLPFLRYSLTHQMAKLQQDVNVYRLLLDNSVFDPRRLFGWQSTNTIKSEDAPNELPHFSLDFLVQQHGFNQCLDPTYYLLEGRPNYAYLKFLSKELHTRKTLTSHRVKQAILDVSILSLRNYTSTKICSACVIFVELLGEDSLPLRLYLQVATALHSANQHLSESSAQGPKSDIVNLLESALENPGSAREVAYVLDALCASQWPLSGDSSCMIPLSVLLVAFCRQHQLDINFSFLSILARSSDWLSLLSLAQVLSVPLDQVLKVIREIPDDCLVDHLTSALQGRVAPTEKVKPKVSREPKDMRTLYYTRMGLTRKDKSVRLKPDEEDSISLSSEDGTCSDSSSVKGLEVILQPRDLIEQLLSACNSESPGSELLADSLRNSNPHLCLIAASLTQTVNLQECFCCYLVSSLEEPSSVFPPALLSGPKDWDLQELANALFLLASQKCFKILHTSFLLFDPLSSLFRFTEFLHSFWVKKEFRASAELLEKYQNNKAIPLAGQLGNPQWVQDVGASLLRASLESSSNAYEQRLFLEILTQSRLHETLSEAGDGIPDFGHLQQLLSCVPVRDLGLVVLPMTGLLQSDTTSQGQEALRGLLAQLQALGKMQEARRFGQLAEIPSSHVLLSQLTEEAKLLVTKDVKKRIAFWDYCQESLLKEQVLSDQALQFFQFWSERTWNTKERYTILVLVNEWFTEISEEQEEWEQEMWRCCLDNEVERQKEGQEGEPFVREIRNPKAQHSWECWDLDEPMDRNNNIQEQMRKALEDITFVLLDKSHMESAWKLAKMYHHYSAELNTVLICLKLARGIIESSKIDPSFWKSFLTCNCDLNFESSKKQIADSINTGSTLLLIMKMSDMILCGKEIARQIVNHYKVSQLLQCDYVDVLSEPSPIDLLDRVLNTDSPEKYGLAKEVITVHHLPDQQVVQYLFRRVTNALTNIHSPLPSLSAYKLRSRSISLNASNSSWSPESSVGFQLLLRLCQDPAQLGNELFNSLDVEGSTLLGEDLPWKVSICVYSHECFTACTHMEGISKLLRKARKLTLQLAQAQAFPLMVRMLTGLGRYNEMTYVFDLLRENAQFELLLKKGMEELPLLRLALLDYLKRHHVNDREIQSMLALKFKMFREIAEMLEEASQEKVKSLVLNSQDVKTVHSDLEVVMQDFEAAAKSYLEGSCMRRAHSCARQAQLVALQLHLLSTPGTPWILSLDLERARKFVAEHKRFQESYIVCEAYELSSGGGQDPWEQALHLQVMERGDWDYLAQFKAHLGLSDTRIQALANRYASGPVKDGRGRMQRLLGQCRDVSVRFRLAEQLGFGDMCKDLLQSDTTGAYLKDTLEGSR